MVHKRTKIKYAESVVDKKNRDQKYAEERAYAEGLYNNLSNDEVNFAENLLDKGIHPPPKKKAGEPVSKPQAVFLVTEPLGIMAWKYTQVRRIFNIAVTADPSATYMPKKKATNKPAGNKKKGKLEAASASSQSRGKRRSTSQGHSRGNSAGSFKSANSRSSSKASSRKTSSNRSVRTASKNSSRQPSRQSSRQSSRHSSKNSRHSSRQSSRHSSKHSKNSRPSSRSSHGSRGRTPAPQVFRVPKRSKGRR